MHTFSAPPDAISLGQCLDSLGRGDTLVLLADGVYCALAGSAAAQRLLDSGATLYALLSDARARGVEERCAEGVKLVDFDRLVELSESCPRQLAWY